MAASRGGERRRPREPRSLVLWSGARQQKIFRDAMRRWTHDHSSNDDKSGLAVCAGSCRKTTSAAVEATFFFLRGAFKGALERAALKMGCSIFSRPLFRKQTMDPRRPKEGGGKYGLGGRDVGGAAGAPPAGGSRAPSPRVGAAGRQAPLPPKALFLFCRPR
jgi:hypothetical protein